MKRRVFCLAILSTFLLFMGQSAQAILNLELTQGVDHAIPIAVVPFKVIGSQTPSLDVSHILTTDLQNCGEFKLFDQSAMTQKPFAPKDVNQNYWRDAAVNDVVIGTVQAEANHTFKVSYYLIDTYNTMSPKQAVILKQSYVVSEKELRRLAHRIADNIYQQLTGARGIFSTRIAYILYQRQRIWPVKTLYKLVVADTDGYNPQAILISHDPIMSPAWSPDGKKIAYVSFEHRRAAIYISNVATGQRQLVSHFPEINGAPAWSPDGKKLAVVLSTTGTPKIYFIDLATRKVTQITQGWAIDTEPSFAPDGHSILFTSDRGGSPEIYQKDLTTGSVQRLTFSGKYNAKASFTPDGKSIIFLSRHKGIYDIAIQNLATNTVSVLTKADDSQSPSVAPNGKMIIYTLEYNGKSVLGVVSTNGQIQLRLPESEGEAREPSWSPFL